jgi:hypothetical protein
LQGDAGLEHPVLAQGDNARFQHEPRPRVRDKLFRNHQESESICLHNLGAIPRGIGGVEHDGGILAVGKEQVEPDLVQRFFPQVPHNLGNEGHDGLLASHQLDRERRERPEEAKEKERAAADKQRGR